VALAVDHVDDHALAVDVSDLRRATPARRISVSRTSGMIRYSNFFPSAPRFNKWLVGEKAPVSIQKSARGV